MKNLLVKGKLTRVSVTLLSEHHGGESLGRRDGGDTKGEF